MYGSSGVCRTCLRADNLVPIFARAETPERYTVALFLTTGLQIEQDDELPQTMCSACVEFVNSAIQFRNTCHRSERHLIRDGYERTNTQEKDTELDPESIENPEISGTNTCKVRLKTKHSKLENILKQKPRVRLKRKHSMFDNEKNKNDCDKVFDNKNNSITEDAVLNENYKVIKVEVNVESLKEEDQLNTDALIEHTEREFVYSRHKNKLYEAFKRRYSDEESILSAGYTSDQNTIVKSNIPHRKTGRKQPLTKGTNRQKRELLLSLVKGPFDPNGPIQCKVCKKTVGRWSSFRSHCKLHLGFDFVCEYCGKSFISITQLRRHKGSHHGEERSLSCTQCPYTALDRPQLILHERREHTGERPYICDTCGASYHSRRCLIQHMENHNTARTVQCSQCPSLFKSRRHLARHTYGCHSSAAYHYRCHVCQQLYSKLKYARRHMHKMHGLTTQQQGAIARVER